MLDSFTRYFQSLPSAVQATVLSAPAVFFLLRALKRHEDQTVTAFFLALAGLFSPGSPLRKRTGSTLAGIRRSEPEQPADLDVHRATGVGVSSELPFTDIRPLLLVVLAVTVCVRLLTASRAA